MKFKVIGAGLAGVEAAWQIANNGYNVSLYGTVLPEGHKKRPFAQMVFFSNQAEWSLTSRLCVRKHPSYLVLRGRFGRYVGVAVSERV